MKAKVQIAVILFSVFILALASCSPQTGWVPLHPASSPPPLALSGFVYDTNRNEAILFGGIYKDTWSNETWIWDGDTWHKADTDSAPSAREKAAMAFDESRNKVVLFGGRLSKDIFNDTWEWDGKSWLEMKPAHQPPARCCHALAYDRVQKKVILYGGWNENTGTFYNDTWAWDGKDWTELPYSGAPLAAGHSLSAFSSENVVIAVPSSSSVNTWKWDGTKWDEIATHPEPSRSDGRSAYDSEYKRIIFFGGIQNSSTPLNDTWIYDGFEWNLLNLPAAPTARYAHNLFYDTKRQSIILFGGVTKDGTLLNDTWELKLPEDISGLIANQLITPQK
jgi:N-acetylneuraminic acid mutarotase